MIVRRARIEDAAEMASLSGELGYPCPVPEFEERLRRMLAREGECVLVAEEEGVVGWTQVHIDESLATPRCAEIHGLVVSERWRNRGIGKKLLEVAEGWAAAQGLSEMRVRSNVVRLDAHRFYEREGYATAKQQKLFVKRL